MELIIEYFGTLSSVIVAISLMQKNVKKLRILNLVGSLAFTVYGIFIRAWPVAGLNGFIVAIDLYYIITMSRTESFFEIMKVDSAADSPYLKKFVDFYRADICKFVPDFCENDFKKSQAVFVLRDMNPASLILYREEENTIKINLDYAVPAYRDMKNAAYFLKKAAEMFPDAYEITAPADTSEIHRRYMEKVGFVISQERGVYIYSR